MTVGPVTIGGKMSLIHLGGMKDSPISKKAQTMPVPISAPVANSWVNFCHKLSLDMGVYRIRLGREASNQYPHLLDL